MASFFSEIAQLNTEISRLAQNFSDLDIVITLTLDLWPWKPSQQCQLTWWLLNTDFHWHPSIEEKLRHVAWVLKDERTITDGRTDKQPENGALARSIKIRGRVRMCTLSSMISSQKPIALQAGISIGTDRSRTCPAYTSRSRIMFPHQVASVQIICDSGSSLRSWYMDAWESTP